jgi:hypothetical protein
MNQTEFAINGITSNYPAPLLYSYLPFLHIMQSRPIITHNVADRLVSHQLVQNLPWCVQWELARIIQSNRANDEVLDRLFEGFCRIDFSGRESTAACMQPLKQLEKSIGGGQSDEILTSQEQKLRVRPSKPYL